MQAEPGSAYLSRRGRRRRPWLGWLVVVLGVIAFVQAYVLFPLLFRGEENPPGLPADLNLPELTVRVFVAAGDPAFVLKSPLDLPAADRLEEAELDRHLFPGGARHRYYHLHALHPGEGEAVVDLGLEPVVLLNEAGESLRPVDLASVVRERVDELPPFLRLYLENRVPRAGRIVLESGERRTVLLAFRAEDTPDAPDRALIGDRPLSPRLWRKDDLDRRLESPRLLLEPRDL